MLVVPPCFDNRSAQPVWTNCPYSSSNGPSPEYLTMIYSYRFRYSTSESRSRVVSEGGLHPVTSTLWQTVSLYSTRSKSSIFSCRELYTPEVVKVKLLLCFVCNPFLDPVEEGSHSDLLAIFGGSSRMECCGCAASGRTSTALHTPREAPQALRG